MFDYFDSKFLIVFVIDLISMLAIYVVLIGFSQEDSIDLDRIKRLNITFYNNNILTYHLMYLLFMYLDSSIYMNYNYYFYEIIRCILVYLTWSIENNHYSQEFNDDSRHKKRFIEQSQFFARNYGRYHYFMNLLGINKVIDFKCVINLKMFRKGYSALKSKNEIKEISKIKQNMIKCNKQRIILYQIDPYEINPNYNQNEIIEENIYILYPILVINPIKSIDSILLSKEKSNKISISESNSFDGKMKINENIEKNHLVINDNISNYSKSENSSCRNSNLNNYSLDNSTDEYKGSYKENIIPSEFLQNCSVGFIAHFKTE